MTTFEEQLRQLATTAMTKQEWVRGYLDLKPDAFGMQLILDYNSIEGLGDRLGWFSMAEADRLIQEVSSSGEDR